MKRYRADPETSKTQNIHRVQPQESPGEHEANEGKVANLSCPSEDWFTKGLSIFTNVCLVGRILNMQLGGFECLAVTHRNSTVQRWARSIPLFLGQMDLPYDQCQKGHSSGKLPSALLSCTTVN